MGTPTSDLDDPKNCSGNVIIHLYYTGYCTGRPLVVMSDPGPGLGSGVRALTLPSGLPPVHAMALDLAKGLMCAPSSPQVSGPMGASVGSRPAPNMRDTLMLWTSEAYISSEMGPATSLG